MSRKPCDDCQREIDFKKVGGRWQPLNLETKEDHRLVCTGEKARAWRIRRRLEAGWFPTSPSAIKTYLQCPTRYADLYTDALGQPRIPDRELPEGELGQAFHRYVAARQRGETPPTGQLIPLEYVREYLDMTTVWERQFEIGRWPGQDAAIEDRRVHEWEDESGLRVQLLVIVDRWVYGGYGRVLALDWKTGWKTPREDELWKDPQAICTGVALRNHPDLIGAVKMVGFNLWLGRYGGKVVPYEGPILFTEELLDAYEEALKRIVHRMILDEEFAPNPYCDVCPPGRHDVVHQYPISIAEGGEVFIRPPRTAEEAEELAHIARSSRRIGNAAMGALRPYTEAQGPVLGIGLHAHTSYEISDTEAARQVLIEKGQGERLDWWLTIPGARINSLMNTAKWSGIREEFQKRGLIKETVGPKYEMRDPEPEGIVVEGIAVPDEPAPELPPKPRLHVLREGE